MLKCYVIQRLSSRRWLRAGAWEESGVIEIRFHGRGGQGTVVAAVVLAKALFSAGFEVQTFPVFGVERRGAPVEAYLRLDTCKIHIRSNVYQPHHVVVQDRRLLSLVDVTKGLAPGGWVLANLPQPPKDATPFEGYKLAWVDATAIAVENHLGTPTHPIVNTAMLGAFARVLGQPALEMIHAAIETEITVKPQNNTRAATQAYAAVCMPG